MHKNIKVLLHVYNVKTGAHGASKFTTREHNRNLGTRGMCFCSLLVAPSMPILKYAVLRIPNKGTFRLITTCLCLHTKIFLFNTPDFSMKIRGSG